MNRLLLSFLLLSAVSAKAQLTVEKIMRDPKKWMGTSPSRIQWSEDSKKIYFRWNPDKNPSDSTYTYSLETKKIEKTDWKERRLVPDEVVYNKDFSKKLFTKSGDIFIQNCKTFKISQLTNTLEEETSPEFSGDEKAVVFTSGPNLFTLSLDAGAITQITDFEDGEKKKDEKQSDEQKWLKRQQLQLFQVLKERKIKEDSAKELTKREEKALWPKKIYLGEKKVENTQLSPDGKFVTYVLVKSESKKSSTIVPEYVTETGYTEELPGRSKVGAPGDTYEFWIYNIAGDTATKVTLLKIPGINDKPDFLKDYPATDTVKKPKPREVLVHGPFWAENGERAIIEIRSLDNKDRWIMAFDPKKPALELLDRQRDEAWIGGPGIGDSPQGEGALGWINDSTIYFQSEADGYSHLYAVTLGEKKPKQLTKGEFEVQDLRLSRDKKQFFLTTNEGDPGQKHFYKMAVSGGERTKLTKIEGANNVTLSPDESQLAILHSQSNKPWELYLTAIETEAAPEQITRSFSEEFREYPWRKAKVVKIATDDGKEAYARVYEPKRSNKKAVIFVHGAGYLQNAHKWWSQYFREYMFNNLLTDKGYTVVDVDYRASSGYGRDWRTGIYRHMGGKDLDDHLAAVEWLRKNYKIDPKKIGIYGGSYGGFIALMAQFTKPGIFAAGAALRPVTDWAAYNDPYTSNILNLPQNDSLAYARSSPINFADGLQGKLLICHGMLDLNVHFQDVARLAQKLIELGKDNWELAAYPLEDHAFTEASSWTDEYKRILKLFEEM